MVLKFKSDVEKFITFNFLKKTKLVHMAHQLTCTAESDLISMSSCIVSVKQTLTYFGLGHTCTIAFYM